jgi:L-ascorbate metabolism protein UlaG (beta-lactamase superfamily)
MVWDRDSDPVPSLYLTDAESDFLRVNRSITTITWIGHSSFLIQIDGINLLTDPVLSDRIFRGVGPRRFIAPGLASTTLPGIDLICISHNHYDHLDLPTIRALGNKPQYLVPLGVETLLARQGIDHVHALSWWEHMEFGPIRIHSVPAQHFSVRGLFDHNKTLWTGWLIEGTHHRIYFAGDTGFFEPQFREIKNRFRPIHVAILPIGASQPSWLMQPVHLNPFEAVEALKLLEAEVMVPCHWGTFKLSEEGLRDPLDDLCRAAELRNLSPEALWIPEPGKIRRLLDGV